MKRYSLIVVLHIIGIAFLSVGVYLLGCRTVVQCADGFLDIVGDWLPSVPFADDAGAHDAPSGREPAL